MTAAALQTYLPANDPVENEAHMWKTWHNLPQSLSEESKEIKVKNVRTALRLHGFDGKRIEIDPVGSQRGSASIWRIKLFNLPASNKDI